MANRLRRFVEDHLPWFDPILERRRNDVTEAIRQRSIASRIRAERVIAEYRAASKVSDRATAATSASAERVIDEVHRDDA